ncbi:DUF4956 domain-containing protein [Nocardioides deserti]|uniref:DUF4956 domain-containing protein n=1 Tax=Nocardioides deserti TaxID=1588644 RepID=A0ABR6U7H1_9ACTN|nr:DUF4956 domain-containing protein [Nocardioides deserti]MBC2960335.1 DUF4956 domain-containing protein [Nocardioides deserti]GGO71701.1 DUF4956 domain-containing protein [Nocardioides deserti]
MQQYVMLVADLAAITVLVGLFLARHRRRELVVAYLGINMAVLAVTATLASSTVGAGLGLGLFGVLSIIRLRSQELAHHEIAYYFAALAVGLLCGLTTTPTVLHGVLLAGVLGALWLGDHPRTAPAVRQQELLLDRAMTEGAALTAHLEQLLGTEVLTVAVRRTDLVNDTTLVDVRHRPTASAVTALAPPIRIGGGR